MTRRAFAALFACAGRSSPPNIVLIVADDLGYGDLASYGARDIRTPNIDRIGQRGVRFTHCYANAPECTPTRTALLTGRYQQRVGGLECAIGVGDVGRYDEAVWLQQRGELGLPDTEVTLSKVLKKRGYRTGCFGKWHLGYQEKFLPRRHGFDEFFGILGGNADYFTHREPDGRLTLCRNERPVEAQGYLTDLFAEEAIAWLKKQGRNRFFLYLAFTAPHTPLQDPDGYDPNTGTAPWRNRHRPTYVKMVERMDQRIGDVLAQLRAMGQEENTVVVMLSDNGADPNGDNGGLRGGKSTLWEGGIRVPCLIQWLAGLPAGTTVSQVAITMDLMPTLMRAANVLPGEASCDGINLLPVLRKDSPERPRRLFWRYKRGEILRKAVRDGDLKLVVDPQGEELHDLSADEREHNNLLPERAREAEALKRRLAAWEEEVRAPRLRGFRPRAGG